MDKRIEYEYLEDADILEIFFERGPATGTVQIADNITLRFRKKDHRALSLILENFTYLTQVSETGPRCFPLKIDRLPSDLREIVLSIITAHPVNQYLTVLSYRSPRARRIIPIAYLSQSPSLVSLS
ncbi:DUF2283 domain-containing protein [bacterium]|nr:DUF2283 domain-containing protein [bacterium]OIO88127.1 MAG: hypothetical protein AUK02_04155 [Anaerolineae bacterium CG2_30_58_95]PJH75205.1 MAG: hypothetical protein CO064_07890 [Anaerolineae bacterium CG_4_9_14_0_8_um_filter_58_9]